MKGPTLTWPLWRLSAQEDGDGRDLRPRRQQEDSGERK
jgi:hypothetical protein